MHSWTLLILYAALGTGHCMAMCGGLAILATRASTSRKQVLTRFLLYLSGKALTYFFLVLTLGMLTQWVKEWLNLQELREILGVSIGVFMILFGAWQGWKFIRWKRKGIPFQTPGEKGCGMGNQLRIMKNPLSSFVLGWLNGFLPCGFLWLALVYIAQWEGIGQQFSGVLLFSVMTSPGLIAAVGISRLFKGEWIRWSLPVSSGALVLYGLFLLAGVWGWLPHRVHQILVPVSLPTAYEQESHEGPGGAHPPHHDHSSHSHPHSH